MSPKKSSKLRRRRRELSITDPAGHLTFKALESLGPIPTVGELTAQAAANAPAIQSGWMMLMRDDRAVEQCARTLGDDMMERLARDICAIQESAERWVKFCNAVLVRLVVISERIKGPNGRRRA